MTNVDALLAGRDFDKLIAEKVFGFHVVKEMFRERSPDQLVVITAEEMVSGDWHGDYCNFGRSLKCYSTDIAAAFLVVEKLQNRLTLYGPGASYAGWEYQNEEKWRAEYEGQSAFANTAPLAICRVALRVVKATT